MITADNLSRRERQIVEALYTLGEAGAREVADALREPDANDTIRVTLRVLERRGYLRHRVDGRRHVYSPIQPRSEASKSALRRLTRTFFGGSPGRALISFLDASGDRIADDELEALSEWVGEQTKMRKKR